MTRSQLAPGVEIVAVPGRGLAVRTADGEFLGVRTGEADEAALLARLSGTAANACGPGLDRLVRAFEDAGYAAPAPRAAPWPAERRDVLLMGDPVLTEPLAGYLRAAGAEPRTAASPACPETAAAVVWCLDGPVPPGLWDAADRLPERGVAWLRCHREGAQAYVEPLAVTAGDVTSAHVRARRLAATPAHRELNAYWTGPRTAGAPFRLTVAAAGLIAALLADDLTRWATGAPAAGTLPARRRLRRVDLRTLTVTEHPVLPVPSVASMPGDARLLSVAPVPGDTKHPSATPVPGDTKHPSATPIPGDTKHPSATPVPGDTKHPSATPIPGDTKHPSATPVPGDTKLPGAALTPANPNSRLTPADSGSRLTPANPDSPGAAPSPRVAGAPAAPAPENAG
ncbi:hypothetical protein [Streptomyces sp. NPDC006134]|uniref:hypothetical protein n=1 Tax=Streptomyces sp. NPDC006134 TaxID=3154467 RepID=UPI003407335C